MFQRRSDRLQTDIIVKKQWRILHDTGPLIPCSTDSPVIHRTFFLSNMTSRLLKLVKEYVYSCRFGIRCAIQVVTLIHLHELIHLVVWGAKTCDQANLKRALADFSTVRNPFSRSVHYLHHILHNHVLTHCSDCNTLLAAASGTYRQGTLQQKVKW